MIALVCSAAFPTIGRIMTLMNATGMFHSSEAPCNYQNENVFFDKTNRRIKLTAAKISLQESFWDWTYELTSMASTIYLDRREMKTVRTASQKTALHAST